MGDQRRGAVFLRDFPAVFLLGGGSIAFPAMGRGRETRRVRNHYFLRLEASCFNLLSHDPPD